jgi:hypothetical protein
MPSGDRQRVWFPEMIEMLRREWHASLSRDELIALRDRVDGELQRLRSERNIRPPTFACPACGTLGAAAEPSVSVRAMIIALGRFGIADAAIARQLENRWNAHAKAHSLGLDGRPRPGVADAAGKRHPSPA